MKEEARGMNIKDFKVGQTVCVELTGNASRGKKPEQCIEEWEITSVGRKYIKAGRKSDGGIRGERTFEYKESYGRFVQKTNYSIDYIIYETREEIERKFEKSKLLNEVETFFRDWSKPKHLSTEQLKRIKEILEEKQEE